MFGRSIHRYGSVERFVGMGEIVKVSGVSFAYEPDGPQVLKNISLTVEEGSFVVVLGHNGSGKSTLAKLLNAILTPTSGGVWVCGMDTADESLLFDIRRSVGMVFQNPDNQIVSSVVDEDVAFAPENLGIEREEIERRVSASLAAVGMTEYRNHSTALLSGGQKQRIAIAGVIAMTPRIIVLDEPTAMLDPRGRRSVLEVLHKLNAEQGITVIHITHHMDEAVGADRVVVVNDGQILLDGTPQEVFRNAGLLKSVGLSAPQSVELMFELRGQGLRVPLSVLTVDDCVAEIEKLLKEGRCETGT